MSIDYEFHPEVNHPRLVLQLPPAMEGAEGTRTLIELTSVFEQAMHIAHRKGFTYGPAWRHQGWMGNIARMISKMGRLKNMCWRDQGIESSEESVADNAFDMINITGFFIINRHDDNKWGAQ